MRRALVLATAGALLAGCSTSTAGSPQPPTSSDPTSASATTTTTESTRPRDVDLAGVDPCALFPAAARPALSLDRPENSNVEGPESRCALLTSSITLPSYAVFTDIASTAPAGDRTTTVDGFPVTLVGGGTVSCEAFIDVADDQYVSVQTTGLGNLTEDQLCAATEPGVQIVLDTLAQLQPS